MTAVGVEIRKSNECGFDVFCGERRLGCVYQVSHDQFGVKIDCEQRFLMYAGYVPTLEDGIEKLLAHLN